MAYEATVLPAMIASPGDVLNYRASARDVIHEWNYVHSGATRLVLMPVGWETHSSPELGASPQELINDRVLEDCDLLVGIFWTRLGTPTKTAQSGTVEEIERHVEAGKPALVYFCKAPASLDTVDREQYEALCAFKGWCQPRGIVHEFLNEQGFREDFARHLQIALHKTPYLNRIVQAAGRGTAGPSTAVPQSDPIDSIIRVLSPQARKVLELAATSAGSVIIVRALMGTIIQAGSLQLGDPSDSRSTAYWEGAIKQLVQLELLDEDGQSRSSTKIYSLLDLGWQVAERLSSMPLTASKEGPTKV